MALMLGLLIFLVLLAILAILVLKMLSAQARDAAVLAAAAVEAFRASAKPPLSPRELDQRRKAGEDGMPLWLIAAVTVMIGLAALAIWRMVQR